jgi:hypothetical protein
MTILSFLRAAGKKISFLWFTEIPTLGEVSPSCNPELWIEVRMYDRTLTLCLFFFCNALGWSQTPPDRTTPKTRPDIYAGYSYLPVNFWKGSVNIYGGENGWNAGFDAPVIKGIAGTADIAQYYSSYSSTDSSNALTFLAGPRFFIPVGSSRIRPFADVLVGGAHIGYTGFDGYTPFKTNTSFAFSADGGLDYRLNRHLLLRAQGGYLHTSFSTSDSEVQQYATPSRPRISTGIVYQF